MTAPAAAHREVQAGIAADTVAAMQAAWEVLDLRNLDVTFPRWFAAVRGIVAGNRLRSVEEAQRYYDTVRRLAGLGPLVAMPSVPPLDLAWLTASMLVTGPVTVKRSVAMGRTLPVAGAAGMVASAGAAQRIVLDGGRSAVIDAARSDPHAHGWARIGSSDPCAFCAMLISRGPVYRSDTVGFRAHDSCRCSAEPIFDPDRWDGRAEQVRFRAMWEQIKSERDPLSAFRALRPGWH